jgi:hypothetical protein
MWIGMLSLIAELQLLMKHLYVRIDEPPDFQDVNPLLDDECMLPSNDD